MEIMALIQTGSAILGGAASIKDFIESFRWAEADLQINEQWLEAIKEKGLLDPNASYRWVLEKNVSSLELNGTYEKVIYANKESKTKYCLVRGRPTDRSILMKKIVIPAKAGIQPK